jgi:hypothetical protein
MYLHCMVFSCVINGDHNVGSLVLTVHLCVKLFKCSTILLYVGVMFLLFMMWNSDLESYFITSGSRQSNTQTTEAGK